MILRSEHPDAGPYFLVDRAGYGVSWRKPSYEIVPTGEVSTNPMRGNPFTRKLTWIPIYKRAALAFALLETTDITPTIAKKIADDTYRKLGDAAEAAHAERFAHYLLSKRIR
jgi:hypothetical protein